MDGLRGTFEAVTVSGRTGSAAEADQRDQDSAGGRNIGIPPPRFAVLILHLVLVGFLVQSSVNLYSSGASRADLMLGVGCFAGVCGLQALHSLPRGMGRRRPGFPPTLGVQALLTYLPTVRMGETGNAAGGFLAASVLLLLPYWLSWPVFLLVVSANPLIAAMRHDSSALVVYAASSTLITGLMIYGMGRLVWLVSELKRARTRWAAMAVAEERLRFARDLHDLLGYSLSAITLQSEVAIRHLPHNPEQVKEELTSILAISRQALTDVRHVAQSYRDLSLGSELQTCVAMLESAAIEAVAHVSAPLPEGRTSTILATVLREAVANMLRHSKVQHCVIRLARNADGRVRLSIDNDGTWQGSDSGSFGRPPLEARSDSGGLANLEVRLAAVGGTLTAGLRPDGRFEVVAEVPAESDCPAAQGGGAGGGDPVGDGPGPGAAASGDDGTTTPRLWLMAASRPPARCGSRRRGFWR